MWYIIFLVLRPCHCCTISVPQPLHFKIQDHFYYHVREITLWHFDTHHNRQCKRASYTAKWFHIREKVKFMSLDTANVDPHNTQLLLYIHL